MRAKASAAIAKRPQPRRLGWVLFAAFLGTIVAANFLVTHIGREVTPSLHVVPVGFGLTAPSGAITIGFAFTLRDAVQRTLGVRVTLLAIAVGGLLSAALSARIAAASATTFLVAELADLAVYTPLERGSPITAVVGSNVIGSVLDSLLFVTLAFGWKTGGALVGGQVLAKLEWSLILVPLVIRRKHSLQRPRT